MKHRITMIIGDWSGDGHRETETEVWLANKDLAAVEEAYEKGSKILGVDIIKTVCVDYEDSSIETELFWKIANLCPDFGEEWDLEGEPPSEENAERPVDSHEWPYLVMAVAKIGDPDLEVAEAPHESTWKVGGYGLYY